MKEIAFSLDLKDDPKIIAEYIEWHLNVWPEIMRGMASAKGHRTEHLPDRKPTVYGA